MSKAKAKEADKAVEQEPAGETDSPGGAAREAAPGAAPKAAPGAGGPDTADKPIAAADGEEIARLEAEVAGLKDQLLRALAETENVRNRAQRERADTLKYAAAPVLKDLLTVADNLSRAVESVAQGDAAAEARLETLLAGVKLTEKELNSAFERHHVVKLDPLGERLDPHRHEAMFEVPDPNKPSGIVVQVVQPGYLLHDRLLRPARVGVSRNVPAAAGDSAGPSDEQAGTGEPGGRIDTSV